MLRGIISYRISIFEKEIRALYPSMMPGDTWEFGGIGEHTAG